MTRYLKCMFLALLLISTSAMADVEHSAKMFAGKWIGDLYPKAESSDIVKIVSSAFEHGARHRIDPFLILSVIKKESSFNKKARNKGSKGLMQVIPYWHKEKIKSRDIFNIDINVEVGTRILRECMDRNSQNLDKTLRCYRGANDRKYISEVKNTRLSIRRWVIENQFKMQLPVYYVSLDTLNIY